MWVLCLSSFFFACSPAKYVGKGEYLLNRVKVKTADKGVSLSELKKNIRQRPNTRILGMARFHLGLYNLSGGNEDRRFNRWLRTIGEAPVIYSPFLTERSIDQMKLYLNNKGYFQAEVSDTVWYRKRKAFVEYRVQSGLVTRIGNFSCQADSSVRGNGLPLASSVFRMVLDDTNHTLIHEGMPLDVDMLEEERKRVVEMLRTNGYYNFSKDFIQYYADTLKNGSAQRADLLMKIVNGIPDSMVYRKYRIGNIRINLDYDPMKAFTGTDTAYRSICFHDDVVVYSGRLKIRPRVILETVQFEKGEEYNVRKVAGSYSRLQALNLFKFINIVFRERRENPENPSLDCEIQLTPMKRQSYNVFLEGTNNSGNIGVGGNFSYNHRNVFRGGENLTLSFWGALKKEKLQENELFSTTEVGAELKLVTPQFWAPVFRLSGFRRDFAPKTSVFLSYSWEHTQFYHRRVATAKFGYLWRRNDNKWRYNFDLLDLNYVMMPFVNREFIDGLKNQYVKSAYTDHLILSANCSAVFTDQVNRTLGNFSYFRGNLETSGNFLLAVDKLFGRHHFLAEGESFYKAFGVRFAQFVKADGEYRFHQYMNPANSVVYRLFLGCGYPYGNMKALPFEEAYSCGGANGIRAWQTRTLGPGSYAPPPEEIRYPNSVGDFKMEANVEYRFKLFWLLEGALFLDAGNIWNINRYETRPGTRLARDFYRQIAVGSGMGLRLNATFFLLRFDLGMKMHDPSLSSGRRFVLFNRNGGFKKSVLNIAIGYPF